MPVRYKDTSWYVEGRTEPVWDRLEWSCANPAEWEPDEVMLWRMKLATDEKGQQRHRGYDFLGWNHIKDWVQISRYTGVCTSKNQPNPLRNEKKGHVIIT